MIKTLISAAAAAGSLYLTIATDSLAAERRVALVIGNSQYANTGMNLSNPKNDATDVAGVLAKLGFEVIQATDARKREFDMALAQFARRATEADSALFFYAGHAMQFQGRNYLMPVDAELEDDISLRYQMIAIDDVRAALDRANGVRIMILDACRNNPLAEKLAQNMGGQSRSFGNMRGLARVDKTQGMVVAYSTAADDVAMDGNGRNSPYTTALIKRLQEPGLEVEMMFRRIAADVNTQTAGKQRPETYISLLNEYYLNQTDRTAWDTVKDAGNPAVVRDFIARFPSSPLLSQAQARLELIERPATERPVVQTAQRDDAEELRWKLADAQRRIIEQDAAARERETQAERERAAQAERDRLAQVEAQRKMASLTRPTTDNSQTAQPSTQPVIVSDTPALVAAAQRELRRLGCYTGDDDGRFSASTHAAIWRYLSQRGRQSDGSVTMAFVSELKVDRGNCGAEKTEKAEKSERPSKTEKSAKVVKSDRGVKFGKRREKSDAPAVVHREPVVVQQAAPVMVPRMGFGMGFGMRRGFGMHF
jgi:Caspase domain/Putative peptidoglycan binding domain